MGSNKIIIVSVLNHFQNIEKVIFFLSFKKTNEIFSLLDKKIAIKKKIKSE